MEPAGRQYGGGAPAEQYGGGFTTSTGQYGGAAASAAAAAPSGLLKTVLVLAVVAVVAVVLVWFFVLRGPATTGEEFVGTWTTTTEQGIATVVVQQAEDAFSVTLTGSDASQKVTVPAHLDGKELLITVDDFSQMAGEENAGTFKAALTALARHWALELGDRGVNVNVVEAGLVETDSTRRLPGAAEMFAGRKYKTMMGERMLEAADVADAVLFLASPLSDLVQGQTLVVDGGAAIHV